MKKRLLALLLILATLFALSSCSQDSAPTGMKTASDAEKVGYKLYVPEEWTVSNLEGITAAYVSTLDSSSISLVEAEMPTGTIQEYFEAGLADFPTAPSYEYKGEALFGNAKAADAHKYTFEYEYAGHKFGFMQIFVKFESRFFIFTYSALLEKKNDEKTYYDYHLEDVQDVIDNAFFLSGFAASPEDEPTSPESDGYILASDKSTCGFSLYLPENYDVTVSSGIVAAESSVGASLTVMKMTLGQIYFSDYWKLRKGELESLFGEITELSVDTPTVIGNVNNAYAYEYEYTYSGTRYRVYQVFLATGSGYAFTMTAPADSYADATAELEKIMEKIVFE